MGTPHLLRSRADIRRATFVSALAAACALLFGPGACWAGSAIPRGYRAVGLPLDRATAEELSPEHRVDILLDVAELSAKKISAENLPQGRTVRDGKLALLTRVLVLDMRGPSKDVPFSTIQLALNPMEVQNLALAVARKLKITIEKTRSK